MAVFSKFPGRREALLVFEKRSKFSVSACSLSEQGAIHVLALPFALFSLALAYFGYQYIDANLRSRSVQALLSTLHPDEKPEQVQEKRAVLQDLLAEKSFLFGLESLESILPLPSLPSLPAEVIALRAKLQQLGLSKKIPSRETLSTTRAECELFAQAHPQGFHHEVLKSLQAMENSLLGMETLRTLRAEETEETEETKPAEEEEENLRRLLHSQQEALLEALGLWEISLYRGR